MREDEYNNKNSKHFINYPLNVLILETMPNKNMFIVDKIEVI